MKRISLALEVLDPLKKYVDESFLKFVLCNREWIMKMSHKCNTKWHGGMTISVKDGNPTHAKFFETDLI
jgi:hypothetical protein